MELAERRTEWDVLNGLFSDCLHNRGQIVLITGGVASGKTKLLTTFADHVAESDALVLTATCAKAERTIPLGIMGQLFQGAALPSTVHRDAARLLDEHARMATAAKADPALLDQTDARVMHGLCTALLDLARERPVLLGIDDVQFADPQSLQALLYLQRRMRSTRILMILNEWSQPRPRQLPFHTEVTRLPYFSRLRLAPLSRSGVAKVLAQRLDALAARELAPAYHQTSGGNPLLVHALLEDYLAAGRRAEPVVGDAFGHAVLTCLHRWEPTLLKVARGVAVLGESASPSLLGRLLGTPADSAAQVLDVLTMAGLLDNTRFRHPAARAAVLGSLAPEDLAALHVQTAELLHAEGGHATVVAGHLIAAEHTGSDWAVGVLRDAAEHALDDDEPEHAVVCLDLAYRACADERERATITAMLARIEWRTKPTAATGRITKMRTALREGHLNDRRVLTLIKSLLWQGQADEAAQTLRTLIATAESAAPLRASDLRLIYLILSYSHPPLFPRLANSSSAPSDDQPLSVTTDPSRRANAALATVLANGPDEAAISSAEHLLQTCPLTDETLDSLLSALLALMYADRADKAAPWCDALLDEVTSRRAHTWQALLGNVRADIAIRQGDLLVAADYARTALAQLPAAAWGVGIGSPLSTLILATTAMGEVEEAAGLIKQPVPEEMFQTWFGPQYLHARGHYLLATGRVQPALDDFHDCGALMTKWQVDHPAIAPWRSDVAQARLRIGQTEQAAKMAAEQLTLPGTGIRTRGISLRILAATGAPDRCLPRLEQAVDLLRTADDRFELATALSALSHAHRTGGESEKARTTAEQAAEVAKSCQASPLYGQLISGLGTSGTRAGSDAEIETEGLAMLSKAEWRVASLAARGYTNRTISLKLGITVSTVEQHLTRVYRKLDVNSRTDLPMDLPLRPTTLSSDRDGAPYRVPA